MFVSFFTFCCTGASVSQGRVFSSHSSETRFHRQGHAFLHFLDPLFSLRFREIHIGRPWGPLGVPNTLLDAPWTSPWTLLGHPSAPMAPEVCFYACETGFSMKNERLACIRAQLAPPRASVGPPRAPVGTQSTGFGSFWTPFL